jgi:hypothetical protein
LKQAHAGPKKEYNQVDRWVIAEKQTNSHACMQNAWQWGIRKK